jgi:hypothetical protein
MFSSNLTSASQVMPDSQTQLKRMVSLAFHAALRNNKQCPEKLKGTDGDGSEKNFAYWWIRDVSRSLSNEFLNKLELYL